MPRYNHAVTIAFEAWSDDPKGPSDEEYRQGLINRIRELDADKAWGQVNVDSPFDTVDTLVDTLEDDTFICERCARIFDVEDSVKPYGKKGPMLCTSCAEKENVDA